MLRDLIYPLAKYTPIPQIMHSLLFPPKFNLTLLFRLSFAFYLCLKKPLALRALSRPTPRSSLRQIHVRKIFYFIFLVYLSHMKQNYKPICFDLFCCPFTPQRSCLRSFNIPCVSKYQCKRCCSPFGEEHMFLFAPAAILNFISTFNVGS